VITLMASKPKNDDPRSPQMVSELFRRVRPFLLKVLLLRDCRQQTEQDDLLRGGSHHVTKLLPSGPANKQKPATPNFVVDG